MSCGMNRGMRFIVLLSISRPCKFPVDESANDFENYQPAVHKLHPGIRPSPLSKPAPGLISRLFLDQTHKIEIFIKLVRLCPGVTQKSLLVQLLGKLSGGPGQQVVCSS